MNNCFNVKSIECREKRCTNSIYYYYLIDKLSLTALEFIKHSSYVVWNHSFSLRSVSLHYIFSTKFARPRPPSASVSVSIFSNPIIASLHSPSSKTHRPFPSVNWSDWMCFWLQVCSFQCHSGCTWFLSWAISLLLGALFFMWSNMIWASASRALVLFRSFLKRFSVSMSPLLTWGVMSRAKKSNTK